VYQISTVDTAPGGDPDRSALASVGGSSAVTSLPPGTHLEALKGDRKGQHSIRINDQYRICFWWADDGAHDVEITDYH